MIQEIKTLKDFNDLLKGNDDKLIVVDFTATWCGPCRMIAPKFQGFSDADENKNVVFAKVDVDQAEEVAAEWDVSSMPTFMFFINGEKVDTVVGANEATLKAKIERWRR